MPHRVQTNRSTTKNQRPAAGTREPGELYVNLADLQLGVTNATKNPQDLLAVRFFSSATDYAIGDFVIYAGVGYRAKVAITAGAFNAANWDTINVTGSAEPPIAAGTTSQYWRGDKSWQLLDKTAVGLANVDNTSDANKPVSSAQQTALNLKANLASPTFTGDPKAPTPAFPDNDTSIATTAFVSGNFAPILSPTFGGDPRAPTPATSDNDTSIATTAYVKANLVPYAPLNSPVFTGNPTAPTPTAADSDTSIATTAFVQGAVGNKITDAPSDGLTYGRKNAAWATVIGGASMLDGPPDPPLQNGQLWVETDTGNTYAYYVDPTGVPGQWIQISGMLALPVQATAQTRNRIVNPAMQISQENGNTSGTTSGYFAADQWQASFTTTGTVRTQRVAAVTPNGSPYRYRLDVTVADTSLAAGEVCRILQAIEGIRLADFRYGSASAKQAVLRFGFKAPAGTYAINLRNSATNRSYVALFTIAAGQANVDTEQVFVIPGDTLGTWLTDTGAGIYLAIVLACGTTWQGAVGWQAGNVNGTSAVSNGLATLGNVFELFDVGLHLDLDATGVAPKWQLPDEAEELRACQRYFQIAPHDQTIWSPTPGATYSNTSLLPVVMRAAPALSVAVVGTPTGGANAASSSATATRMQYVLFTGTAGALTVSIVNRAYHLSARM